MKKKIQALRIAEMILEVDTMMAQATMIMMVLQDFMDQAQGVRQDPVQEDLVHRWEDPGRRQ